MHNPNKISWAQLKSCDMHLEILQRRSEICKHFGRKHIHRNKLFFLNKNTIDTIQIYTLFIKCIYRRLKMKKFYTKNIFI